MKIRILVTLLAALITFGMVGNNFAAESGKRNCPPSYQSFVIHAFTEAEAKVLWPTAAEAYATQEDAAVDYPDRSLEAFIWSNIVVKDGLVEALESSDRDNDGVLCVRYKVLDHGSTAKLYPDYDPLYIFTFVDQGPVQ